MFLISPSGVAVDCCCRRARNFCGGSCFCCCAFCFEGDAKEASCEPNVMSSAFIELRESPAAASERGVWMAKCPAVVAIVGILCVGNDERGGLEILFIITVVTATAHKSNFLRVSFLGLNYNLNQAMLSAFTDEAMNCATPCS